MAAALKSFARLYNTLRHLRGSQMTRRPINRLKRRLSVPFVRLPTGVTAGELGSAVAFDLHDPWNSPNDIRRGHYRFLNQKAEVGFPPKWKAADLPLLWQFNLHYFGYLGLLEGEDRRAICTDWISMNPVGAQPAWHPYPISLRVVNWLKWAPSDPVINDSIYQQAAYLYRNLETDLGGNHLIENTRALIFAGLVFDEQGEARRWLRRGLRLLETELAEQILPDGGHYERSPMYHAIMLEVCLDVLNVTRATEMHLEWLADTVQRMLVFDRNVCHPDGMRPLFNDATYEIAPSADALQAYASRLGFDVQPIKDSFPDTGIFVHRLDGHTLIVDGGPIGPDHLPAHAHADIFGYELSIGGRLFATDTGVHEYQQGEKRSYSRSTAAHNCLVVDEIDQAECWSSFRVARRFKPEDIQVQSTGSSFSFRGRFPGYARLIGDRIQHERQIDSTDGHVTVRDVVTGRGSHLVQSFLHVHPDLKAEQIGQLFRFTSHEMVIEVQHDWPSARLIETPWYLEFGKEIMRPAIMFACEGALPAEHYYSIHY